MPEVGVLVLSYNALEYTRITIESIFRSVSMPFYLLVVDNGSTDTTQEYLKNLQEQGQCRGVVVCQNSTNLGAAKALNQGLEIARKLGVRYLAKCDNDLYFWPDWLERFLDDIKGGDRVAMVAPLRISKYVKMHYGSVSSKERQAELSGRAPFEELEGFFGTRSLDDGVRDFIAVNGGDQRVISEIPGFVPGHCELIKMDVLEEIGFLADPRYVKYGTDDIDLCWECLKRGYEILVDREVFVYHFRHKSQPDNEERRRILYYNNKAFYEKWAGEIEALKWNPEYDRKLNDLENEEYDILRTMGRNW